MIRSIYTINRNMNILQKKQENTSSNIANVNTPGYKFQDIVQNTLQSKDMINFAGGRAANRRQELGGFTYGNQIDEVYRIFEQGTLSETNKDTDFALVGDGFFTVQMDNGDMALTRNGNFKVNEQNQLVTLEGYPVIGVDGNGQPGYIEVINEDLSGVKLLISNVNDYGTLENIGNTFYVNDQRQYDVIDGEVQQSFLEMSNVSIADEMVKMIEISREFESNQKLLHAADETLSKAVNEVGRV